MNDIETDIIEFKYSFRDRSLLFLCYGENCTYNCIYVVCYDLICILLECFITSTN